MYLKSLEIQGFKSFPDKTRLDFDKGITAVVGPNGSGKSNIGDAVRWVLGEQSSKTLRGAKMEDVIFAGTQLRKPMGFAQVTLEISNNERMLPVDDDTVTVTRKLYRSGESEYMINGKPRRLKDITELFMDTGMGRDGYSIIGQGRIAEIVSAKSGERRDIFEEAAGISKFRYKKAEAERRLASAQENILRLNDIVSGLRDRVEPLRIQSEKAARFIELSGMKKEAEITVWIHQLDELKASLKELEEKLLINTGEYETADADIERAELRISELTRDMRDGEIRIEELRNKIHESEQSASELRAEIAVCENEIKHCEDKIEEFRRSRENAENFSAETDAKIEKELKAIREAEEETVRSRKECELSEKKLAGLVSEIGAADAENESTNALLNNLYSTRSSYTAAIENGRTGVENLRRQLSVGEEQKRILEETLVSLDNEKKETLAALQTMEEKEEEQTHQLEGLRKIYGVRSDKLDEVKKNLDEKELEIKDTERRISFLEGLENSMEGFNNAVRQILKAAKSGRLRGVRGSVAQLLTVENKYSTAIEIALGAALQNIAVSDESAAKECIAYLKENRAGRATFLPLTSVKGNRLNERGLEDRDGFIAVASDIVKYSPEYAGIVASLLGRTAVAEDIDSAAAIAKYYGYKFRVVTLDGQVVNAGGSFTGGSVTKSSGVLTRKSELDELRAERGRIAEDISSLKKLFDKIKAETDKFNYDIAAAAERLNAVGADKIQCRSELMRISSMKEQTERQLQSSSDQADMVAEQIEEMRAAAESAEKNLADIEKSIAETEKKISENSEKQAALRSERESLSDGISALKIRAVELSKEIDNARDRIAAVEEQRKLLGDSTAELAVKSEEQRRIAEEKRARIAECEDILSHSGEKIASINEQIRDLQDVNREKEQEATGLRRTSREYSDIKEKLASEKTRLEERRSSIQKSHDDIIRSLETEYEMYVSEARGLARDVSDIAPVKKELDDLRKKIRALGTVNVAAIDEYKEVSEQYKFMSGELEDVESSKHKLEGIIKDLTETMKQQFSDCFAQIKENFSNVFTEMFGGGKGELLLSDPDNVLESGIEINAAPPGKVIKSLSLLSGGEQAFVAIVLYFSILMIRPSPFCILDEIEAALDDVNVTRYAQYLHRFTDTTQFITVTHRRGTMEEADVMYGVTMQQKGISRLLKMEQLPEGDIS